MEYQFEFAHQSWATWSHWEWPTPIVAGLAATPYENIESVTVLNIAFHSTLLLYSSASPYTAGANTVEDSVASLKWIKLQVPRCLQADESGGQM